jgi:O-antigen/teichoic acid export membrane protein
MFWQTTGLILVGIQGGIVSVHLAVLVPYNAEPAQRAAAELMLGSVNALLVGTVLVVGLTIDSVLLSLGSLSSELALTFYVSGTLMYQYARALAVSRADLQAALKVDLVFVSCGWGGISLLWYLKHRFVLIDVIELMAICAVLAAIFGLSVQTHGWRISLCRAVLQRYRSVWKDSMWSVLGVLTTELQGRSYVYIVGWLYGGAALGELFAAQFLSRPLAVLYLAWSIMARPQLAGLREVHDPSRFSRFLKYSVTLLVIVFIPYFGSVYLFWDELYIRLYAKTYPDIAPLVALWAAITLLTAPSIVCAVGMEALRAFRLLFLVTAYGCIISLGMVTPLVLALDARASLGGLFLVQGFESVVVFFFLKRTLHERRRVQFAGVAGA